MTDDELAAIEQRLREICLALPGTTERLSHGAPGFFAGRQYLAIRMRGHHRNEFPHLWFAAAPGVQAELVDGEPDRFFVPPYVGGRGWVGLRLDGELDWDELAAICADAHRNVT
jgi:hypothetical protein